MACGITHRETVGPSPVIFTCATLLSRPPDVQNLTLRAALASDAAAIWNVRLRAIDAGCRAHYPAILIDQWLSAAMPETFPTRIESEDFVVSELDSKIAGFGCLRAPTKEIHGLFVSPELAGKGLGRLMLTHLEAVARSKSVDAVWLKASLNAVPFYMSSGYIAGRQDWHTTANGLKIECIYMEKALVPP